MKLYIKQKVFSFTDSFVVKDEAGNDKYFVEGEFLSLGHKLHIKDVRGNEVGFIRQRLMTFMPRFEITIQGRVIGELVKKLTFFRPSFFIEGSDLTLDGDFFDHEYILMKNQQEVMNLYKEWFTWGDSYVLDIARPEDELLSLAIVLAVDCEICSSKNRG